MILIIDGYNVLKQAMRTPHIKEQQKNSFLRHLDLYARTKKHQIIVVFDGGEQGAAYKEYKGLVLIIYSGARESADEVIVRHLETLKDKSPFLISSDRELRKKAAALSVDSLPAPEFYDLLTGVQELIPDTQKKQSGTLVKTSKSNNEELDKLMRQESRLFAEKTEDSHKSSVIGRAKGLSKSEKKILKKVKKL